MPCPVCNQKIVKVPTVVNSVSIPCTYTAEQLTSWESLLECAKENRLFPEKDINAGLGTIRSALGRSDNICYFQNYLRITEPLINKIIATGQCQ